MTVPYDYDDAPERYQLGTRITREHSVASLDDRVADMLLALPIERVLDVRCADEGLRAACLPRVPGSSAWTDR